VNRSFKHTKERALGWFAGSELLKCVPWFLSRVVSPDKLMPEAISIATKLVGLSALAVAKASDCINKAYKVVLSDGYRNEQYDPAFNSIWQCVTFS